MSKFKKGDIVERIGTFAKGSIGIVKEYADDDNHFRCQWICRSLDHRDSSIDSFQGGLPLLSENYFKLVAHADENTEVSSSSGDAERRGAG